MPRYEMILASGSPRRRQLLSDLGFDFMVRTADVDESSLPDERPEKLAERLAVRKAYAVAEKLESSGSPRLIVAADTVVALGGTVFGKPRNSAEAEQMLVSLRGRQHQVHSAVCVLNDRGDNVRTRVNTTQVQMRSYSLREMQSYLRSGDSMDKAGAYAIQHPEFAPVESIDGCLTGVMGLPLADLCALLAEFGVEPACPLVDACERHTHFRCCQRAPDSGDPAEVTV